MLKVGIVGASGYVGIELVSILSNHKDVIIDSLYTTRPKNLSVEVIFPFQENLPKQFTLFNPEKSFDHLDILYLATPHGVSHQFMSVLMKNNIKIIDLSADFRLNNESVYKKYYMKHHAPDLLANFVYGCPELYFSEIEKSSYIAVPGCYSTSIILGLKPLDLLNNEIISLHVDSKSGVSGAGKKLEEAFLFTEINKQITAYSTATHRHQAELDEQLNMPITFSPHLIPIDRGILSSMYIHFKSTIDFDSIVSFYQKFYKNKPFIKFNSDALSISTRHVYRSNFCMLSFQKHPQRNGLIVFSAIDNLIKGAAGQAVQCMNIMEGLSETEALMGRGNWI